MYKVLAILNALGLVCVLIANYLANSLPINGYTTGELSDAYPNVFVPAGLTFSIWGIIYGFLIGFVIYQFINTNFKDLKKHHFIPRISFWFLINCAANTAWIFAWHHKLLVLSLVLMLVILSSLIMIYLRLEIGRISVKTGTKWLVHIPFSIYLAWITVATIANVTALLVDMNWDGFGLPERMWGMIMIFVATLVGFRVYNTRHDVAFILVLLWAFLGIFLKRSDIGGYQDTVAVAAGTGMALLTISLVYGLIVKQKT